MNLNVLLITSIVVFYHDLIIDGLFGILLMSKHKLYVGHHIRALNLNIRSLFQLIEPRKPGRQSYHYGLVDSTHWKSFIPISWRYWQASGCRIRLVSRRHRLMELFRRLFFMFFVYTVFSFENHIDICICTDTKKVRIRSVVMRIHYCV